MFRDGLATETKFRLYEAPDARADHGPQSAHLKGTET